MVYMCPIPKKEKCIVIVRSHSCAPHIPTGVPLWCVHLHRDVEWRGGEVECACVGGERDRESLEDIGSVYVTVYEKTDHLAPM